MSSLRRKAIAFMTLIAMLVPLGLQAAETNAPAGLRLSLPLDYQVHQRATRTQGTIIVAGSLPNAGEQPVTLEARLLGAGTAAVWRKLFPSTLSSLLI